MKTATIHAKYVDQPREGKSLWSIKTDEGVVYKFDPRAITPPEKGSTLTVEYTDESFNNIPWRKVHKIANATAAAPQGNGHTHNDPSRNEFIFVCGALNNALSSGKVEPNEVEMEAFINAARTAYNKTFGKVPF